MAVEQLCGVAHGVGRDGVLALEVELAGGLGGEHHLEAASSLNVPGIASNEKISFKLLSPIFSKYLRSVQKDSDWDNAVAANTLAAGSNVCI